MSHLALLNEEEGERGWGVVFGKTRGRTRSHVDAGDPGVRGAVLPRVWWASRIQGFWRSDLKE